MARTYRFRLRLPGGRGGVAVDLVAAAGPVPDGVGPGVVRVRRGVVRGHRPIG